MTFALSALICIACVSMACAAPSICVSFGSTDSQAQKLTAHELNAYFGKLFSDQVVEADGTGRRDLVIGTPESNALIASVVNAGKIHLPEGKNQDQGYVVKTLDHTIYIAGRTDIGVLYGLYTLLERYGAYFEIDGETLPPKSKFRVAKLDIAESPAFKYRGLLPWDNFLCGMSCYNLSDYKLLIDRATRMKLNMLQFHFYTGMAFFTETIDGKTVDPSCIGMPVDVFKTDGAIGQSVFEGEAVFGSKPYVDHAGNPQAQAKAVQDMMRAVIDYSHVRGWATCVGFELMDARAGAPTLTDKPSDNGFGMNLLNPLDPHNADISLERYRSLVNTYPKSDFYWMWQTEARGILSSNVGREPGAAEFRKKYERWATKSPAWNGNALSGDIDYAYLFREVANRLTPRERSRLATGGWSVEHLFPNIDADFPKELIFASLNNFDVTQSTGHQYKSYQVAENGRRAWMIDWWEFDGEQWFPQFRASWQEKLYKSCMDYGVESVTLLGWKLTGIEHNVRYLSEFSWNPKLTADEFYKEYASKVYGGGADAIAAIYEDYDNRSSAEPSYGPPPFAPNSMYLSPGWASMPVPALPTTEKSLDDPQWKNNVVDPAPEYLRRLEELRARDAKSIATIASLLPDMTEQGKSQAELMMNRLEVRRLYCKSLHALYGALVQYDRIGRSQGVKAAGKSVKPQVAECVSYARMAVEKYAEDVRNRGDQGVVAQMDEQYYRVLHRLCNELDRVAFATIDWTAFRMNPVLRSDFEGTSPWTYRDGKATLATDKVDGRPTLRVTIGGDNTRFNSAFIHIGAIDLDKAPFLDFRIRTTTKQPLAILFQLDDGSQTWYSLDLIGKHTLYSHADALPEDSINDGAWHRVTWDLSRVVRDGLDRDDRTVSNLAIGSWMTPSEPIEVEFQDFSFGARNLLD